MKRAVVALTAVLALAAAAHADDMVVQPADRDVSPPGVMPIPPGPLLREPAAPAPPDPPRWRRYVLPQTTDAATFAVPGLTIHLSGVAAPAPTETCTTVDGETWPCGATALFTLRRFLHGRGIECYFPYPEGATDVTAPCRIGREDIALWLLQNGWARSDRLSTDRYRAAALAAACGRLGIWRGSVAPADCAGAGQAASSPASALAISARVSGMP
jgi:endonuclease YncB( thermonuclease family)